MFFKANGLTGRTFRQWISTFKEIKGIITKQINFPAVAWKKIRNNRCKRRYITAKGAESIELKATKIVPTNYGKCCVVGIQILTSQILSSIGVAVVRCGRQNVVINATDIEIDTSLLSVQHHLKVVFSHKRRKPFHIPCMKLCKSTN